MKNFSIDKQTIKDLNISGKYQLSSIFNLYNTVRTRGAERLLEQMFATPLCDVEAINARRAIFQAFGTVEIVFPFTNDTLEHVIQYLDSRQTTNAFQLGYEFVWLRLTDLFMSRSEYESHRVKIAEAIAFLIEAQQLLSAIKPSVCEGEFGERLSRALIALQKIQVAKLRSTSFIEVLRTEHTLKVIYGETLRELIEVIFQIDLNLAVSTIARERNFCYAEALCDHNNILELTGFYHPYVAHAVENDLKLSFDHNVLFLTGANMAGKSTFMKSFGVAIYLAHMGFPVAAQSMRFTVQDGMYTSINVPDNMEMGYSHFYAEVMRVKHVAAQVASGKRLVVIFDELFKGTNVKDAYDATVAVTEAFSRHTECSFIISTHIMEAGLTLKEQLPSIQFSYLPTLLHGVKPQYTYRLAEGIAADRHGMQIIKNEGILDILDHASH